MVPALILFLEPGIFMSQVIGPVVEGKIIVHGSKTLCGGCQRIRSRSFRIDLAQAVRIPGFQGISCRDPGLRITSVDEILPSGGADILFLKVGNGLIQLGKHGGIDRFLGIVDRFPVFRTHGGLRTGDPSPGIGGNQVGIGLKDLGDPHIDPLSFLTSAFRTLFYDDLQVRQQPRVDKEGPGVLTELGVDIGAPVRIPHLAMRPAGVLNEYGAVPGQCGAGHPVRGGHRAARHQHADGHIGRVVGIGIDFIHDLIAAGKTEQQDQEQTDN